MHEFDIECTEETCWHDKDDLGPLPHSYVLTRCVECDARMERAMRARDLIAVNELAFEELSEGASKDQPDGFFE
jgi:hypothetical protein